ncbi:hypothetical protein T4E_1407 [Trichinella pseudospiralis]|uniref:Uncharacterized protein n=1 Tax=Trichinella pseudospiralis TaxID=6337 RepID=A0A0V0WSA3_TRIPS|nr:hypothetical protein T4E_1407 [Trichinella pseudospiralis]
MAFYMDLNEKCYVHEDDFKNRLLTIFTYKYTLVIYTGKAGSLAFYMDLNEKS